MTKETLTNDYLQIFVKFVKSIDFTELQWRFTITNRQADRQR
jgi:hypothetical protein